jgi:hypothetical protein
MNRFIKSFREIFSVFAFAFLFAFQMQASEPTNSFHNTQSPPHIIEFLDSLKPVPLLIDSNAVVKNDLSNPSIVEDSIAPPCDIIFFKSGKIDYCKIIETTPTTISYKMCDYVDGPTIIVNKTTVHKIHYANGRDEIIGTDQVNINAYVRARKDPMATWALICSLVGILVFPAAIVGVILGICSLIRIKRSNGALRGKGSAKAAIIVGGIFLFLWLLTL